MTDPFARHLSVRGQRTRLRTPSTALACPQPSKSSGLIGEPRMPADAAVTGIGQNENAAWRDEGSGLGANFCTGGVVWTEGGPQPSTPPCPGALPRSGG